MSLSLIVKKTCPVCDKTAVEISRFAIGKSILLKLKCGHLIAESNLTGSSVDYYTKPFPDGRALMPYQVECVKFVESANARCLIADEQGLGKTFEALASIAYHVAELSPAIIVTKTTIKIQWLYEIAGLTGSKKIQILSKSTDRALPVFDFFITTYDILKKSEVFDYVDPKTLVLDECQAIKDHLSGRAKAVQQIVDTHKIEHIIGLSGTPIKNHAGEYFTILNLLRPTMFPEYTRFLREHCDHYETMYGYKVGGLSDPNHFHDLTKDFIIRRTKNEVLKDLPELTRRFQHVEFSDKRFQSAYSKALDELEELFYAEDSTENRANQLAVMNRLRQITGISKVNVCVDFVTDFLLSTDRKIVIFLHHHVVDDMLTANLNQWLKDGDYHPVIKIDASMSGEARAEAVKTFKDDGLARVCVASTLAAGEGLNLQFCSDAVMLERQWNPANEEQAEARFHRYGQINPVGIVYMIASETIDEYFTELVEKKRAIVSTTLDNREISWQSEGLMNELASILISKGKKSWKL